MVERMPLGKMSDLPGKAMRRWDIIRGLSGVGLLGAAVVRDLCGAQDPAMATANPTEMLPKIQGVPKETIVFMLQADALILHLNPLQEAVQDAGDTNFADLAKKIEEVCKGLAISRAR